jgi:hypothetical protein
MSRTAGCFLALGFLVTLAAACGDDDGDTTGIGGSAGAGGRGTAGAAGAGGRGSGGGGGTAGMGTGGTTAGTGGSTAGTGGSTAGTGGSSAGTGGVGGADPLDPDAGADAAADSGGEVVVGELCPNFVTAAGLAQAPPNNQVVFARVFFNGLGGAEVVLRNVASGDGDGGDGSFPMFDNVQFCAGPGILVANCIPAEDVCNVEDSSLAAGAEVTCNVDLPDVEGELALANVTTEAPVTFQFLFAYLKYAVDGAFTSPGTPSLESEALAGEIWNGETIDTDAIDNAIVLEGEGAVASDYTTCTAVLP